MTPTHPKYRGNPVKEIGEHKFYEITQADEILHTRYMAAEVQELYIRSGISQDFLEGISQLLIDRALDASDLKKFREEAIAIGQNLKGRLGFIASLQMYEELACVFFMMDNEPAEYLPEWQEKKKEVWRNDKDFFLFEAFKRINPSETISMSDIIAVFQAVEERVKMLPTLPD
jgi:hypothetical protein